MPFIPSESIATICLSTNDVDVPKDFTITGFGLTSIDCELFNLTSKLL